MTAAPIFTEDELREALAQIFDALGWETESAFARAHAEKLLPALDRCLPILSLIATRAYNKAVEDCGEILRIARAESAELAHEATTGSQAKFAHENAVLALDLAWNHIRALKRSEG